MLYVPESPCWQASPDLAVTNGLKKQKAKKINKSSLSTYQISKPLVCEFMSFKKDKQNKPSFKFTLLGLKNNDN